MTNPQETIDLYADYLMKKHSAALAESFVSGRPLRIWVDENDEVQVEVLKEFQEDDPSDGPWSGSKR